MFERRKKNSRVSGKIDRRSRFVGVLDRDAFQDLARSARSVCAPRPREPGSHVIMAEVAEKKRFEVKKVRTTRLR